MGELAESAGNNFLLLAVTVNFLVLHQNNYQNKFFSITHTIDSIDCGNTLYTVR